MAFDKEEAFNYILNELNKKGIRYELHRFPSGASMFDIWYNDFFCVIQLEINSVGISLINSDNNDFTTMPDERFFELEGFIEKFRTILA